MAQHPFIKGSLSGIILKLLQDNGRMYGYEMTRAVRDMSGNKVKITEAALYPALRKLVADGILDTQTEVVDGRIRKYYLLSPKGQKESPDQLKALQEALDSLKLILNGGLSHG